MIENRNALKLNYGINFLINSATAVEHKKSFQAIIKEYILLRTICLTCVVVSQVSLKFKTVTEIPICFSKYESIQLVILLTVFFWGKKWEILIITNFKETIIVESHIFLNLIREFIYSENLTLKNLTSFFLTMSVVLFSDTSRFKRNEKGKKNKLRLYFWHLLKEMSCFKMWVIYKLNWL